MIDLGARLGADGTRGRTAVDHYRAAVVSAFKVDRGRVTCRSCGAVHEQINAGHARTEAEVHMVHREGCLVPLQLAAERAAVEAERGRA